MNVSDPRVAIVTGASSGIGKETALELSRRGYAVVLAARRADRLREVAAQCQAAGCPAVLPVPTDVAHQPQVQALVEQTLNRFGRIDVMVNNAGYGLFDMVHQTDDEQMRRIFDVNFFGVFHGCKAVAPVMIAQQSGHIFNVSSVIGRRGTPFHGAYCATKFAVIGLTDAMRVEMKRCGVRVTAVLPALTETEFFDQSIRGRAVGSSFRNFKGFTPPAAVARRIVGTIGKNKPELVFTFGGKLLTLLAAISPRLTDRMMQYYFRDLAKRMGL